LACHRGPEIVAELPALVFKETLKFFLGGELQLVLRDEELVIDRGQSVLYQRVVLLRA